MHLINILAHLTFKSISSCPLDTITCNFQFKMLQLAVKYSRLNDILEIVLDVNLIMERKEIQYFSVEVFSCNLSICELLFDSFLGPLSFIFWKWRKSPSCL